MPRYEEKKIVEKLISRAVPFAVKVIIYNIQKLEHVN